MKTLSESILELVSNNELTMADIAKKLGKEYIDIHGSVMDLCSKNKLYYSFSQYKNDWIYSAL